MKNLTLILTALYLAALLTAPRPAPAGWTNDPFNGMVTVCNAPGEQNYQRICQLTGNRTLIAWDDLSGNPYKIYFQILNGSGNELLPHNGILLVTSPVHVLWTSDYNFPGVLPDGSGGCIMAFRRGTTGNYDVYGQRIDSLGNRLWGENGLPLIIWPSGGELSTTDFVSDLQGNFFVGWGIYTYPNTDIYVQKFNVNGQRIWGDYGVPVCTESHNQLRLQLVPDGQGSVEALWRDMRISSSGYLYFQHLDSNGTPLLQINGVQVHTPQGGMISTYGFLDGVSDGLGGSIWHDVTDTYPYSFYYLLRINGSGQTLWYWNNGVFQPQSADALLRYPDGTYYASSVYQVYHFDVNGNQLWSQSGISAGNTLVAITNGIIGSKSVNHGQISGKQAIRTDSIGLRSWISPYILATTGISFMVSNSSPDGNDGAIYPFVAGYGYPNPDIKAQKVNNDGSLGTPNKIRLNPQKTIETQPGETPLFVLPTSGPVRIELFDVLGRKLLSRDEGFQPAGPYTVQLGKEELPSGVYLLKLISAGKEQVKKIVITR